MLPGKRPMDNMAVGWDRPQEDEFALALLGLPSPYADLAFPTRPPIYPGSLDLQGLSEASRHRWKRGFYRYLQALTLTDPRRLILKSPPHSCRIPVLLELFPDARFIHIVRNPYVLYPSTMKLWRTFRETQGLEAPSETGLSEHVFSTFNFLFDRLEEGKKLIRSDRFFELKYEDLVANPMSHLQAMYQHLGLGDFDRASPTVQNYLDANKSYERNRHELTPELKAEITRRWGDVILRYGYPLEQ
jgi:hypothetical protein